MSMARFLLALACISSSAAPALPSESAAEMELALARTPSLYLHLDIAQPVLEVKVRGMVLDTHEVRAVKFVFVDAAGAEDGAARLALPLVVRTVGGSQAEWRQVVAPPTLVPYSETAEPVVAKPTATVTLPDQYEVDLDTGWHLVVGPESPYGFWSRLGWRLATGWQRLIGRRDEPPPPSIVVEMSDVDSRALVHLLAQEIPILIACGDPARQSAAAAGD